jgi:hypothetical protein
VGSPLPLGPDEADVITAAVEAGLTQAAPGLLPGLPGLAPGPGLPGAAPSPTGTPGTGGRHA